MGAWGVEPWSNDSAADWFGDFFEGLDVDQKISKALEHTYDNYDEVRAAAYLLQVLGISYIWPGDLDRFNEHVKRAISILEAMIDPESTDENMDFLELWGENPEVIASVQEQIVALEARLFPE